MFWRKLGKSDHETTVIVGLGNPGKKYDRTRHNIGYQAIERLADRYGMSFTSKKFEGLCARGEIEGHRVILVKPLTFMNNSGRCVRKVTQFYKTDLSSHLIILYDDIDLDVAHIRVRPKGSAGSHKGMASIVQHLKTQVFPRIRIGIGAPPPETDLVDWVLDRIPKRDEASLSAAYDRVCDAVALILDGGLPEAMNRYNRRG